MNTSTIPSFDLRKIKRFDKKRSAIFHPKADIIVSGKKLKIYISKIEDIPLSLMLKAVENHLPDVSSINQMNVASTFHLLYNIKTKRNKEYVLKIHILPQKEFHYSLFLEQSIQNTLARNHLLSSKIIVDFSQKMIPYDFLIFPRVTGKQLDETYDTHIYANLGKMFKKIHTIRASGAGMISIENLYTKQKLQGMHKAWNTFLKLNLSSHLEKIKLLKLITKEQSKKVHSIFKQYLPRIKNSQSSLLHNDPSLRNIFYSRGTISGIIDWEDAMVGDPIWDIAFIHTFLFRDEDTSRFESFCKGYGISSSLFHSVGYWIYYTRIVLLKAISRQRKGYYNKMGKQIDRKRIRFALQQLQRYAK